MTPAEFLEAVVRPNRAELDADFKSVRLAFNCVAAVDSLAAHLFWWLHQNEAASEACDTAYRETLARRSDAFGVIRDIAKAQKHVELMRGQPALRSAKQVAVEVVGYGEGRCGRGRYGGPPQVLVRLDDGSWDYVESLLDDSIRFLEEQMRATGALS